MVAAMGWVGLIFGLVILGLGVGMLRFTNERAASSRAFWARFFPRLREPQGRPYLVYRYVLGPFLMIVLGGIFAVGGVVTLLR